MGDRPIEIARRSAEAFARGDLDGALANIGPGTELLNDTDAPGLTGVYVGRDGVMKLLEQLFQAFEEYKIEPIEFTDAGDRVLARSREIARGRGSGLEVDRPLWSVYEFDGDVIARLEIHVDRDKALRVAGLAA